MPKSASELLILISRFFDQSFVCVPVYFSVCMSVYYLFVAFSVAAFYGKMKM